MVHDAAMKRFRVDAKKRVRLDQIDPSDTSVFNGGKKQAADPILDLQKRLGELQELLYAEHQQKVLIVLQGMDTSGKDGVVRHVMSECSPQGMRVVSFKKPTEQELAHDYLWRIHAAAPAAGEIAVFNRSHYEDVLVVRVHSDQPKSFWTERFRQINDFERMLAENGTIILKFFLHISSDEQRERLQARIDDPTKRWKFEHGDLQERKLWDTYMRAYEEALDATSTKLAPWYVVPANAKWFRNWVIGKTIVEKLDSLKMKFPEPDLTDVLLV
jgi:PPK2 family polyphosphate:nucleotide phosphotransferase